MPSRYYSFDIKGYHFVVLDGNENKDPPQRGYPCHTGAEQMAWLKKDLSLTGSPVLVFSHQSLEDPEGVDNAGEVRKILEEAKLGSGDYQKGSQKRAIDCSGFTRRSRDRQKGKRRQYQQDRYRNRLAEN
jgi:hypothetical protein